jgi:hypothetical protein
MVRAAGSEPETRVHATFDIDGPERAPGKRRNLPPDLSEDQCSAQGRMDAEADRDARIAISRTPGDSTLVRDADGVVRIQVNMWPTEPGLRCGQAYGEGYRRVLAPS